MLFIRQGKRDGAPHTSREKAYRERCRSGCFIYEAVKISRVTMQGYIFQANQSLLNNMFPLSCFFWANTFYFECVSLKLMEE